MWGTRWRQRLRLGPLYLALQAADAFSDALARQTNSNIRQSTESPSAIEQHGWQPGLSIVIPDRDAAEMLSAALTSVDTALQHIDEPRMVRPSRLTPASATRFHTSSSPITIARLDSAPRSNEVFCNRDTTGFI